MTEHVHRSKSRRARRGLWTFRLCLWLGLAWGGAICSAQELFPPALTKFRPHPRNPVFTAAGEGTWEVKIRERVHPAGGGPLATVVHRIRRNSGASRAPRLCDVTGRD
jgi:hypothetical protein